MRYDELSTLGHTLSARIAVARDGDDDPGGSFGRRRRQAGQSAGGDPRRRHAAAESMASTTGAAIPPNANGTGDAPVENASCRAVAGAGVSAISNGGRAGTDSSRCGRVWWAMPTSDTLGSSVGYRALYLGKPYFATTFLALLARPPGRRLDHEVRLP